MQPVWRGGHLSSHGRQTGHQGYLQGYLRGGMCWALPGGVGGNGRGWYSAQVGGGWVWELLHATYGRGSHAARAIA